MNGSMFDSYSGGNLKFKKWLEEVDTLISDSTGIGILDLPDYLYRDDFDSGMYPEETAELVLEENGYDRI